MLSTTIRALSRLFAERSNMPKCVDCDQFDAEKIICKASVSKRYKCPVPKLIGRACSFSIFMKRLPEIKGRVLEIGCGVARYVCKNVRKQGCEWTGLDPSFVQPIKSIFAVKGTVGSIPFPDDSFDWVISLASIEHWHEKGDGILKGLKEIRRVLKPGGSMLIDCVFFVHGHDLLYFGQDDEVRRLIEAEPWASIYYEEWRKDHAPLPVLPSWDDSTMGDRRQVIRNTFPALPSQWALEVLAVK